MQNKLYIYNNIKKKQKISVRIIMYCIIFIHEFTPIYIIIYS